MKKFKFSLETLLSYKDQVLDREKNDLAALNLQRADAIELKNQILEEIKRRHDEFNDNAAKGISAMEMAMFAAYQDVLKMRAEDTEKEIARLDMEIEKQLGVVTEASKDVKSLEKLEEKQLEDYNFRAAKADERFIEEYVNGAAVRASLADAV